MGKIFRFSICLMLLAAFGLPAAFDVAASGVTQTVITVKGVVVDADNNPVVGAYIVEKEPVTERWPTRTASSPSM